MMNERQSLFYKKVQAFARVLGGELLSETYINSMTKLKFVCAKQHVFEMSSNTLLRNHWCNRCSRNLDDVENQFYDLVKEKGGICCGKYISAHKHVPVKCANGHEFSVTPHSLKVNQSWCRYCYGNDNQEARVRFFALAHTLGYSILSDYVNSKTPVKLKCTRGHIWDSIPNNLNSGKRCRYCGHNDPKVEDRFYALVSENKGSVLSQYINTITKVELICENGHQWLAKPNSILHGTWCPICVRSRGERILNNILSKWGLEFTREYYHPDFEKVSPSKCRYDFCFVYNSQSYLLEYDGIQHFEKKYLLQG